MSTDRATITVPRTRYDQLAAIAQKHGLATPTALIESWIHRAIREGDIPPGFPDFSAQAFAGGILITIREQALPVIPRDRARLLAAVLSAAGGEADPELSFTMSDRKPVVVDLGSIKVAVSRVGRGVRLWFKQEGDGEGEGLKFTMAPRFVAEAGRLTRDALTEQ